MAIPNDEDGAEHFVARVLQRWRTELLMTEKGVPKACLANGITALRGHPEWSGILWFDTLHQRTTLRGKLPWRPDKEDRSWEPGDDNLAANWFQHEGIMLTSTAAAEAIETVARDHLYHPVLDYLNRCRWDGTARIDEWTIRYLGTEDSAYTRAVSSRWLISAIARVMQPGCKADCALILEGRQGLGKSQAVKSLFFPWFTDELAELGSKDAAIQLAGAWCVELAELVGMRRAEIDRVKAFISRTHDRYRPVYGIRTIEQPRQCVFAGTVNDSEYLRDETGGRRFWSLACDVIDLDGLRDARDQLWAEARDRYEAGEVWWIDSAELNVDAMAQQDARRVRDPWEQSIAEHLDGRLSTSVIEILDEKFNIPAGERTQLDANRAAACLKALGWVRYRQRSGRLLEWRYRAGVI